MRNPMKPSKSFYTPGEFARLFHIDKQTLIYYDNQGIFSPAHRSKNGYRYYSTEQILSFAELWSLRNLHVSGTQLGEFNASPTRNKLLELLSDKVMEYEETIASLQGIIEHLHRTIKQIQKFSFMPLEQVMVIPRGRLYFQRSPLFDKGFSFRDACLKSAPLITEYATHLLDQDLQLAIEPQVSLLDELQDTYPYRMLLLSENPSIFENPLSYDPSLYLTMLLPYPMHEITKVLPQLQEALSALHLTWKSPIFLTMMPCDTNTSEHYGCKIEIAVSSVS